MLATTFYLVARQQSEQLLFLPSTLGIPYQMHLGGGGRRNSISRVPCGELSPERNRVFSLAEGEGKWAESKSTFSSNLTTTTVVVVV